jgi:hypothetical protein
MLTPTERYRRGFEECTARANLAAFPEAAQIWTTIAASWQFLLQREARLAAEQAEREAHH